MTNTPKVGDPPMIREKYRSPNYRTDRVAKRYVRRLNCPGGVVYRVFECAARKVPKNRSRGLTDVGAGPTIREYDTTAEQLPADVVRRADTVESGPVEW